MADERREHEVQTHEVQSRESGSMTVSAVEMPRRAPPGWRKLLRLWALYGRMDLLWVMRDAGVFLMFTLSETIMNVAAITGMWLLAERFEGIGHWSRLQVLFLLGYGATANGMMDALFGYNVAYISRKVGRGQLDHILVQPQPIWLALLTEGFVPFSGAALLLPGIALLTWSIHALAIPITAGWLALLLLNLLASMSVALAFQYLWGSLAFWAPRSAEEINSSTARLLMELKSFPLDGLSATLAAGLLTALPVGFVAWYPCRALLGLSPQPFAVWATPLAALAFAALSALMFGRGMAHYRRTGSQRYLPWGHRS
jgi:ABC-2 type transport system permease protein